MNNFELDNYLNDMLLNSQMPKKQKPTIPNPIKNNKMNMQNKNITLFGPYEGFIKGNLYSNLYDPYKKYKPTTLTPNNQYEEDLLNLNQMQFAAHELNLLLDNYPNDNNILNLYNQYRENYLNMLERFENKYGPVIVSSDVLNKKPWAWDNEPWPWEGDAN